MKECTSCGCNIDSDEIPCDDCSREDLKHCEELYNFYNKES
jgi:hypothetical protein